MQFLSFYLLFNIRTSLHPLFNQLLIYIIIRYVNFILSFMLKLIFLNIYIFFFSWTTSLLHAMTDTTEIWLGLMFIPTVTNTSDIDRFTTGIVTDHHIDLTKL
jgi:hypothetical protein